MVHSKSQTTESHPFSSSGAYTVKTLSGNRCSLLETQFPGLCFIIPSKRQSGFPLLFLHLKKEHYLGLKRVKSLHLEEQFSDRCFFFQPVKGNCGNLGYVF